jgi:gamma-glutamyltranspeptidase/glutathione hydrolase
MVVSARLQVSSYYEKDAFDAMVELALAVSYPQAGNIGGGFMVFRMAGETGALIIEKNLLPQLKTCISIQKEM